MSEHMLDYIATQTDNYILSKSKETRKSYGQFFTSKVVARYMASLFCIPSKEVVRVLDPGAGSGMLSAACVERIEKSFSIVREIELTCYETNEDIIPLLSANIEYLKSVSKIPLRARIIKKDYILSQTDDFSATLLAESNPQKYDIIIANPPYFKLAKDSREAVAMSKVCFGAPNIYFLFAAMSLFNLCHDGEMVYIIPRSWTSGAYFSRFREYLLRHGKLTDIHIFTSRNKVFDSESVLQETMIMKVRKTRSIPSMIQMTSSTDSGFHDLKALTVPYDVVVSGKEQYVYLVTSQDEVDVLTKVNTLGKPMPLIGLKMKTGLTVDFRHRELLRNREGDNIVPLFYAQHLKNGCVVFPIGKENEYISDELPSMVQLNRNYLFVKRFTTKEERRRLQCAVYLASHYPEYKKISTQNKINFIDTIDNSEMSEELVCGLYAVLNSTLYDMYYRILNGSTQVNATEMNTIPVPARNDLELLGKKLIERKDYSTKCCDTLLEEMLYA